MAKINKHIEIVCSTESTLSSMSLGSRQAIRGALSKHYATVGITIVNTFGDLQALVERKPDLVFLGMKFIPTNFALKQNDTQKIWLSDFLEAHGIACTGSPSPAHELECDKSLAKQQVISAGLQTSPYYVISRTGTKFSKYMTLSYPLFIKPTNRGGGMGIDKYSVAHNFDAAHTKIEAITAKLDSDSMVEEYLDGREFSVAILRKNFSDTFNLMPIELIAPKDVNGDRMLSADVKSADTESHVAVTDERVKQQVNTLALAVFKALGARDYGRIDIRLNRKGIPQFLEANLIPSLLDGYGNFPKACNLYLNMDYEAMLLHIVQLGLGREVHKSTHFPAVDVVS